VGILLAGCVRVVVAGTLCAPQDPIKGRIAGFLGLLLNVVGMTASMRSRDSVLTSFSSPEFFSHPCADRSLRVPEVLTAIRKA